jgi:hypothetical protein
MASLLDIGPEAQLKQDRAGGLHLSAWEVLLKAHAELFGQALRAHGSPKVRM